MLNDVSARGINVMGTATLDRVIGAVVTVAVFPLVLIRVSAIACGATTLIVGDGRRISALSVSGHGPGATRPGRSRSPPRSSASGCGKGLGFVVA